MMGRRERHHNASGRNEKWNGMNGGKTRSWESTLTTNAGMELLDYQQRKNKLDMVLWNTSQIMRWQPATHGKRNWIGMNKETRNLSHREDKWRTWVIISTINSKILRESFRWNINQDTPTKRMMDREDPVEQTPTSNSLDAAISPTCRSTT